MKLNTILTWSLTAAFAAAFCSLTPALSAQTYNNAPRQAQQQPGPQQTQPQPGPQQAQQQPAPQQKGTFNGRIVKLQDGKYALATGKTPQGGMAGHFLDDQTDAAKYNGKNVQVTGSLNEATNTIRVSNIRPA